MNNPRQDERRKQIERLDYIERSYSHAYKSGHWLDNEVLWAVTTLKQMIEADAHPQPAPEGMEWRLMAKSLPVDPEFLKSRLGPSVAEQIENAQALSGMPTFDSTSRVKPIEFAQPQAEPQQNLLLELATAVEDYVKQCDIHCEGGEMNMHPWDRMTLLARKAINQMKARG